MDKAHIKNKQLILLTLLKFKLIDIFHGAEVYEHNSIYISIKCSDRVAKLTFTDKRIPKENIEKAQRTMDLLNDYSQTLHSHTKSNFGNV